ncbi:MAG: hypothetical protein V2I30_12415 [Erythrobacter sp.]|nr:hypothetical protein [Erythrobacter sp.]
MFDKSFRLCQTVSMQFREEAGQRAAPRSVWCFAALLGVAAPTAVLLAIGGGAAAPTIALGLMTAAMIGAAISGSLRTGTLLGIANGVWLATLSVAFDIVPIGNILLSAFAALVASLSFAARGALFARSSGRRGWLIAFAVALGEAAILISAASDPGLWPHWLLVLLPAQWASLAFEDALAGTGLVSAAAPLAALAVTALATLFVRQLWPRRWTYLIMFTTWLAMAALVWQASSPEAKRADAEPGKSAGSSQEAGATGE